MILKRLSKGKSLRIVNLLGLSVIFACLVLSASYIRNEWSYDRFNERGDRIVRFSIQMENEPVDGRSWGYTKNTPCTQLPEIEEAVFMNKINTAEVRTGGKIHIVNDFYSASSNFFRVFSYKLLEGDPLTALDAPQKAVISRRLAKQMFGDQPALGKELALSSRKLQTQTVFITGVYDDFPANSHFHTDLIMHRPDAVNNDWPYIYFLLHEGTDREAFRQNLQKKLDEQYAGSETKVSPYLVPLKDIHLHSRVLREMEVNGNIYYIYLIAGANVLLLLIVLFNLWLNAGLLFSYNRKYYQLLRLNGAPSSTVVRDESLLALLLGLCSVAAGSLAAWLLLPHLRMAVPVFSLRELLFSGALFLAAVWFVSLLPVWTKMSSTLFLNSGTDLKPTRFSLANVKFMLIAQYAMVMFIVIVGFGISKQIALIKSSQVGGEENNILVMDEQPDKVTHDYGLFKQELLKHPEIKSVTAAMQLPGAAIRDMMAFRKEGETEEQFRSIPILVVGEDFLPFFHIRPIAGEVFSPDKLSFQEESDLMHRYFSEGESAASDLAGEYVINRKALQALGFKTPEEAVGKWLYTRYNVSYINKGIIVGVTDNFTYNNTFEDTIPQVVVQRRMFLNCIMVRLDEQNRQKSIETFNSVWNKFYPDYPANYSFLQDEYSRIYHNEYNAESLVRAFSLLSLIIANLGLIIIMAFVIRRKTKEIGIRKINGATPANILRMLNSRFILWIGLAFVIAIPVAWVVMSRWLMNFAHKTALSWWIFALAGAFVLLLSLVSVSWQSWHAANQNPVKSLKTE